MKTVGIIGGLGPEASLYYYRTLIDLSRVATKHPDRQCTEIEIILYNLNQCEYGSKLFDSGRWAEFTAKCVDATQRLQRAGADFAIIACNTAHFVFNDVKTMSPIPLISIVEETCNAVAKSGLTKVGLFGGPVTMKGHFYQDVFSKRNISVVVPKVQDQNYIASKIFREVAVGIIRDETHTGLLEIARRMIGEESIQGLILGCTELPLILTKGDLGIPFFDTSKIHAESAFRYSLLDT